MTKKKEKAPVEAKPPIPDVLKPHLGARLDDPKGVDEFPVLMDLMTPKYVDGKQVTEPGRITITQKGSRWAVKLDCPTYVRSCQIIPTSLPEALGQLETAIANGVVTWDESYRRNKKKIPTVDES